MTSKTSNNIKKIKDYVIKRRTDIKGRPLRGSLLIENYTQYGIDLEQLVIVAIQSAQTSFMTSRKTNHKAFKLTVTSSNIGIAVLSKCGVINTNYTDVFAVGDLFLEALMNLGFIEIGREYEGFRAPYIIILTHKWYELGEIPREYEKNLLIGTSFKPFQEIKTLRNELTHRPYIKRMTSESFFQEYIDQPFVKALNKIQNTPWKLDTAILKEVRRQVRSFLKEDDKSTRWRSKAIEMRFILAKARAIQNREFYQSVECDYRGRVYYTEPFLNYQSSDIVRGMYRFAEGKPMDESGYKWLLRHVANCYNQSYNKETLPEYLEEYDQYKRIMDSDGMDSFSVDKMTLEDRERWTLNNIDFVRDTASEMKFHMESEKPVSFLAACRELVACDDCEGEFLTHLPIPIDGSNNGWQHLAAISKDPEAGELVSLVPQSVQKDFYTKVAHNLVDRLPEWFEEHEMPMKDIRKGITKRGSMTRAYSAGQKKIAENMYYDCKTEEYTEKYNINEDDCDLLSRNLILAINDTCKGPLKTMKFLQKITEEVLNEGEKCLEWTTPSGFPVIYEVWRQKSLVIRNTIRGIGSVGHRVKVPYMTDDGELLPCRRSFASGCSPNFIHSMDAAHMMMVVNDFEGSFGAIHDSFSTHAPDVDSLLAKTKLQFIFMYSDKDFFENIIKMIKPNEESSIKKPVIGSLDVSDILFSDYFFS